MIILCGKSLSGKSTIAEYLEHLGYAQIKTYTTRARREGEPEDAYHFVSEEEFLDLYSNGKMLECALCNGYMYGTPVEEFNDMENKVAVLTPDGVKAARDKGKCLVVYLYANEKTLRVRAIQRGDEEKIVALRLAEDTATFRDFEKTADMTLRTDIGWNVDQLATIIYTAYERCVL